MGIVDLFHIITILTCGLQHYQHTLHSFSSRATYVLGKLVLFPLSPFCLAHAPLSTHPEFFPRINSRLKKKKVLAIGTTSGARPKATGRGKAGRHFCLSPIPESSCLWVTKDKHNKPWRQPEKSPKVGSQVGCDGVISEMLQWLQLSCLKLRNSIF